MKQGIEIVIQEEGQEDRTEKLEFEEDEELPLVKEVLEGLELNGILRHSDGHPSLPCQRLQCTTYAIKIQVKGETTMIC